MATGNFDEVDLGRPGEANANVREAVSDVINRISPTTTPFYSAIGMPSVPGSKYEWTRHELAAADATNARIDGADAGDDTSKASDRMGNFAQISDKILKISGRAEVANKVGRDREMAYQLVNRGLELRRDMEKILTGNQASLAGDKTTAPTLGSLCAWLETNTDRDATSGADGGFDDGTGLVVAATDSSATRALSQATLDAVIQSAWTEGGLEDGALWIMVSGAMKQQMSSFLIGTTSNVAGVQSDLNQSKVAAVATQAVDFYVSDFGTFTAIPNRFQRDRDVFVLTVGLWECGKYRDFRTTPLARTGDAENRQLLVDYTLISRNEKGSGVIADIDHTTAMVV